MMVAFHRASTERVNAFPVAEEYLFKHYFDEDPVFDALRDYYNEHEYRFEVPASMFEEIQTNLANYGYSLVVVEEIESFVVVKRKYSDHPRVLFRGSVLQRSTSDYNCFVMKDQDVVETAVEAGAQRLPETDVSFSVAPAD